VKLDKLSVTKMRAHLMAERSKTVLSEAQVEALSKNDLTAALREVLKECPLCVANNCSCVATGVQCSAEVCGCLRRGGSQTCRNPQGVSVFDPEKVREHRVRVLVSMGCANPESASLSQRARAATMT